LNIPSLYLNTKKTKSAYQVQVTASENRRLGKIVDNIRSWMENEGRFLDIDSDLDPGVPTLEMIPDRARMALAGFTATDGAAALYASFGPTFASKLWVRDATRSVYVGLTEKALEYPSTMDLLRLQRNNGEILGGSAPLSEFVQNSPVLRPSQANRYNRLAAASISFNLLPGVDAAATLRALETQLTEVSGDGVQAALVGTAKEVISSLARALPLVLLSFLVMYLTLGFLYESLGHPLTVLATLPSALLGGLAGLWIFDLELDIYGFFGLLMLLGIVKKNAIMLVDFARQRQREGVGARQAILEASMERLRPIQLTTLAAAAGALPMLVGTGSGISVLKPVGAILLGGLLVSQVVTLALTPPLYRLVEGASARARWFFDWGAK
jgi:HAE1 family hydrophobic/amphiphilic exporter-1